MSNLDSVPLKTREALPEDLNFIFHSWLSSFKNAKSVCNVPPPSYFQGQHKLVERILRQAKTLLLVEAAHTENIFSYIVYEEVEGVFVLHFAYTKNTYRTWGMMRKLLGLVKPNSNAGFYTQDSRSARFVADKFNLFCNPYILHEYLKPLPPDANIEAKIHE